jgi:hypothetical protein
MNDILYQEIRALRSEIADLRAALQSDVRAVEERLERRLAVVEARVWAMGAAGVTAGVGGSAIMNMLGM